MNGRPARTTDDNREFNRALGARLRAVRNQLGLSLEQVAIKSDGAWPAVVVGSYERGDRQITVARLAALADFYGVAPASLLPQEPPPLGQAEEAKRLVRAAAAILAALAPDPEDQL